MSTLVLLVYYHYTKYIYIYIYIYISLQKWPSGNGLIVTHARGHMMYIINIHVPKCISSYIYRTAKWAVSLANQVRAVAAAFHPLRNHQRYWATDWWASQKWSPSNRQHTTLGEGRTPTKREEYWIHTFKTKAPIGLNVEGGCWASILHSYCTTIFSWIWTVCFRTILGLFGLWLQLYYSFIWDSTCTFLSSEMELFMAMVSNVNSMTIAMDSSFLRVRNLILLLIVTIITYYSWHYQLYHLYGDNGNNHLLVYLIWSVFFCNLIVLQYIYITSILL